MSFEFKLPELSENAKEGTVTAVLVKVGDTVKAEQNVFEVEAGKATVEIPCPVAGTIAAIHVKEGEQAKVGQVVLTVDEAGAVAAAAPAEPAKKEKTSRKVAKEAPASTPAPAAAPVEEDAPEQESDPEPEAEVKPTPASRATAPSGATTAQIATISSASVPASPSTRQFAREVGIDINVVKGSGPGGRVSVEDVKQYTRSMNTGRPAGGVAGGPIAVPLPDFRKWGAVETEPLSNVRSATVQHMAVAWSNIPHVTIHEAVDITAIEEFRKSIKDRAESVGVKLTLTAFLIKILGSALKVYPKFNASLDLPNKQLIYRKYVNVGVAMDTERGLVVPVLRGVDGMNVFDVARQLGRMGDKAKAGKVSVEDMQGGSITLTNIGAIGGGFFTPIVNYPEVAILGVGRGSLQAVPVKGGFEARLMLPLSLSFDHRVIDGADGARFLRWIVDVVRQPALISVEG